MPMETFFFMPIKRFVGMKSRRQYITIIANLNITFYYYTKYIESACF